VALTVEEIDLFGRNIELDHAGPQLVDLHPVVVVVLRDEAERVGPDAEIDVLRDQDRRDVRIAVLNVERHREDPVVGNVTPANDVVGNVRGSKRRPRACLRSPS
jgi:hypothetical protein